MKKTNPYQAFPYFVLRTPLLPYSYYKNITKGNDIPDEIFKSLFEEKFIREAIFLATPVLYDELKKWINNELNDSKKIARLKLSLLKYFSRMSSRCTPFGLFAGCALGEFRDYTEIILDGVQKHNRHTRLDMNYLVALSQDLIKKQTIQDQIKFFPNSSLYKSVNHMRYVEYRYIDGLREHEIIAVDNTIYLEKALTVSRKGILKNELIDLLIDDENPINVVSEFVEELIENQVLISELEPSVSGPEFLEQIKQVLEKVKGIESEMAIIKDIENRLSFIDEKIGSDIDQYLFISENLKELKTEYDIKYLFQTDVILRPKKNILDKSLINSIKKGLSLFNRLTLLSNEDTLETFKKAFYERFEDNEVSLSKALDVEMGVGYKQNQGGLDFNPLIDDLLFPNNERKLVRDLKWSEIHSYFSKKITEALVNGNYVITVYEKDFEHLTEDWSDISDTISAVAELVKIDNEIKIVIKGAGGSSAANLLGRFCHGDSQLKDYTEMIIEAEKKMNSNKILAEINHLPESRVGNILMRPSFRDYEIPYLANSTLDIENQLNIEDLSISIRNNKIILKSKTQNKEIVPRLSNAHNFKGNSLPMYHFLADMQNQGTRSSFGVDLGPLTNEYEFIPRIEFENLILCEALWNIKREELNTFYSLEDKEKELLPAVLFWKNKKKMPEFVLLIDGDNELLINMNNYMSIRMLLSTVKSRSSFKLKEFLFAEDSVVCGNEEGQNFTNQIVVSFYNSERLKNG